MSSARPASEPHLFSPPAGPMDPEFARVLRMADPTPALAGSLTFLPASGAASAIWLTAWQAWRHTLLGVTLAPALLRIADFAVRGCAREMLELDRELDALLDLAARDRSRAAGRRLLGRLASSQGERWVTKFVAWAATDETPAHFPLIYAGQHALFHLPLRLLVPAYAYWEWSAAMSARPPIGAPALQFSAESHDLGRLARDILPSPLPTYAVEDLPAASNDR